MFRSISKVVMEQNTDVYYESKWGLCISKVWYNGLSGRSLIIFFGYPRNMSVTVVTIVIINYGGCNG